MKKIKIKTKEEAIEFLEEEANINVEIVDYKYRVSDNDFEDTIKDTKELIEYANEQAEAINDVD